MSVHIVCLEMKTEQWKQSLIYWLLINTIYYSIMIVIYCTSNRSHDSRFSICICLCSALQYHCLFLCSFLFRPLHSLSFLYLRLLTTSLVNSSLSDALYIRCIYYEIPVKLIDSYLIECTIVFLYCVI
jgi:hypothetical protein